MVYATIEKWHHRKRFIIMRYISAEYILPIHIDPIKNGIIAIDDEGVIQKTGKKSDFPSIDIEFFNGVIMPGLINCHCHLELSHMKGLCPTGTQLIPFISNVVKHRDFDQETILAKIKEEDENMFNAGVQAVGDICNKTDTADQKAKSKIRYYSFIEMYDFLNPANLESIVENYRNVFRDQDASQGNKKSFVPHAPYSVSKKLFEFINEANPETATISMHNQETLDENLLFENGTGGFKEFFKGFGVDLSAFKPIGKTSVFYALANMKPKRRNLFVHNTLCTKEDIKAAHDWSENVYWVTCPNANLYIENRMPNYKNFIEREAKMCIGTDSIMSNWTLSIWEELKTIKKMQSYVPLTELLKWSTLNGAQALGFQKSLGSLETGKSPGLINIDLDWQGENTDISHSSPQRII